MKTFRFLTVQLFQLLSCPFGFLSVFDLPIKFEYFQDIAEQYSGRWYFWPVLLSVLCVFFIWVAYIFVSEFIKTWTVSKIKKEITDRDLISKTISDLSAIRSALCHDAANENYTVEQFLAIFQNYHHQIMVILGQIPALDVKRKFLEISARVLAGYDTKSILGQCIRQYDKQLCALIAVLRRI